MSGPKTLYVKSERYGWVTTQGHYVYYNLLDNPLDWMQRRWLYEDGTPAFYTLQEREWQEGDIPLSEIEVVQRVVSNEEESD